MGVLAKDDRLLSFLQHTRVIKEIPDPRIIHRSLEHRASDKVPFFIFHKQPADDGLRCGEHTIYRLRDALIQLLDHHVRNIFVMFRLFLCHICAYLRIAFSRQIDAFIALYLI